MGAAMSNATRTARGVTVEALKCGACGALTAGPREICPACHEARLAPVAVAGAGVLTSWTIIRRPPAAFRDEKDYAVAVVRLDAGVTVTGRVVAAGAELATGLRVAASGLHKGVPVFRPA